LTYSGGNKIWGLNGTLLVSVKNKNSGQ